MSCLRVSSSNWVSINHCIGQVSYFMESFQTVAMLCFLALAGEYFFRFIKDRPVRGKDMHNRDSVATMVNPRPWTLRQQLMAVGLAVSTGFLLIR